MCMLCLEASQARLLKLIFVSPFKIFFFINFPNFITLKFQETLIIKYLLIKRLGL